MNTKAYRELIRSCIKRAVQRIHNANFLIAESPANIHTLEKTASELRSALSDTDRAIGIIEAHRALTEPEEPK